MFYFNSELSKWRFERAISSNINNKIIVLFLIGNQRICDELNLAGVMNPTWVTRIRLLHGGDTLSTKLFNHCLHVKINNEVNFIHLKLNHRNIKIDIFFFKFLVFIFISTTFCRQRFQEIIHAILQSFYCPRMPPVNTGRYRSRVQGGLRVFHGLPQRWSRR